MTEEEHEEKNSLNDEEIEDVEALIVLGDKLEIEITEEEFAHFIGRNADYYIPKFRKFNNEGFSVTWNWPAFFFQFFWMAYRKMYLWAFFAAAGVWFFYGVVGLLLRIIGLVPLSAGVSPELALLLAISIRLLPLIGFGILGNYIYYKYAKQRITRGKRAGMPKSVTD